MGTNRRKFAHKMVLLIFFFKKKDRPVYSPDGSPRGQAGTWLSDSADIILDSSKKKTDRYFFNFLVANLFYGSATVIPNSKDEGCLWLHLFSHFENAHHIL